MLKDWSALKKLLLLKATSGGSGTITVQGMPVTIAGAVDLTKCLVRIDPYQAGSGDPSPDNVRAISGWTGANVYRAGKNLLDYTEITWTAGTLDNDGNHTDSNSSHYSNLIPICGGVKYTISGTLRPSSSVAYRIYYRDGKGEWISRTPAINPVPYSFTTPENCRYIQVQCKNTVTLDDAQIEPGSAATDYAAYDGDTYTAAWGTGTGTVYGGTADLISGTLTVTHGYIASYDGETLPGAWISDRDVYAAGTTPTTGAEVVYELAEPLTYQLTPEEIGTEVGNNYIWSDCGSYMECSFSR